MPIKLKEITLKPQNTYMAEFFESVAEKPEGKYFKYEEETTNTLLRSGAQTYGAKLGKKFSIHRVVTGETPEFAVGWTTKARAPRTRKINPPESPSPLDNQSATNASDGTIEGPETA